MGESSDYMALPVGKATDVLTCLERRGDPDGTDSTEA